MSRPTASQRARRLLALLHLLKPDERVALQDIADTLGTTVGQVAAVLGLGSIGVETARILKALGMKVIGVSRSVNRDDSVEDAWLGVRVDLHEYGALLHGVASIEDLKNRRRLTSEA